MEADVVTCCSLISALERGGQWQLAEVIPASCQAEGANAQDSAIRVTEVRWY